MAGKDEMNLIWGRVVVLKLANRADTSKTQDKMIFTVSLVLNGLERGIKI
jgi:hypothetical protein